MDSVVRNVVSWGCATLPEAVRMAATVPAAVAGAGERKGRIAPGYDADLVALTPQLEVAATWVAGEIAYSTIDNLLAD
jgi:N-acetylglucosamine-6-phosphate deacetylase